MGTFSVFAGFVKTCWWPFFLNKIALLRSGFNVKCADIELDRRLLLSLQPLFSFTVVGTQRCQKYCFFCSCSPTKCSFNNRPPVFACKMPCFEFRVSLFYRLQLSECGLYDAVSAQFSGGNAHHCWAVTQSHCFVPGTLDVKAPDFGAATSGNLRPGESCSLDQMNFRWSTSVCCVNGRILLNVWKSQCLVKRWKNTESLFHHIAKQEVP